MALLLGATVTLRAQDVREWDRQALRDSVVALLRNYELLQSRIKQPSDIVAERQYIHLFSNPRVQVVNDLDPKGGDSRISIEDYLSRLGGAFPDGLGMRFDLGRLVVDPPRYDRNNRYLLKVRTWKHLEGVTGGKAFSSSSRVIIEVAFFVTAGETGRFLIHGSEAAPRGLHEVGLSASPALTTYRNEAIASDGRLDAGPGAGYSFGMSYSFFGLPSWGLGAALRYNKYAGYARLETLDPIGGFDPHLANVAVKNELWCIELPVMVLWKKTGPSRLEWSAGLGISPEIRIFEQMSSGADNTLNGSKMRNVITDLQWIPGMNRINLGIRGQIECRYRIGNWLRIFAALGARQGLSSLDDYSAPDFSSARYQGQFNPFWGAPGSTVNRSLHVDLGLRVLFTKDGFK